MKKILVGFICVVSLFGQTSGQNVVNQNLVPITNIIGGTIPPYSYTYNLTNIQNIGQTSHILRVSIPSGNGSWNITLQMYGSMDGTNYFSIGPLTALSSSFIQSYPAYAYAYGYQSFPFIKAYGTVGVAPTGGNSIQYRIDYIGTSSSSVVSVDAGLYAQFNTSVTTGAAGGTLSLIGYPSGIGNTPAIYGYDIFVPSTVISLKLGCANQGGANMLNIPTLASSWTHLQLSPNLRPLTPCGQGDNLTLTSTGTGNISITLYYRQE